MRASTTTLRVGPKVPTGRDQDELRHLTEFDPKSDRFMDNPWEFYRRLRERAPVFHDPRHDIHFVTRYEDVDAVLKDHARFSSQVDRASMRAGGLPARVLEIRAQGWPLAMTLSQNDGASHDVFKSLAAPFFTPSRLKAVRPFIELRAQQLLEAIERGKVVDLAEAFAVPLPIAVIGHVLGVETCGDATLKRWSDAFADEIGMLTCEARAVEIAELTLECHRAMMTLCETRAKEPREDVISHLVAARIPDGQGGERALSEGELLSMLTQMLVAGNETTTNTLLGGLLRLALDKGLLARLRSEPEQTSRFVEELLRLESPVQGQFRRARCKTMVGGVEIPEGALLHVRLASANRDELVFGEDDDAIRLTGKRAAPHKAFGAGMHFCLGAMLSRMELNLAFKLIAETVTRLELATPVHKLRYHTHFHLRGLEKLPMALS